MSKALKKVGIVLGAVALVATGIGAVAGGALLGVGFATIGTIAGVAAGIANVASTALAKTPKQVAAGTLSQILIASDAPRPYPMGETHFGGVLRHRTGYGGTVDGVENPYLFDVIVYSGVGPVQSITPQIEFGAVPAWYTGYIGTDTQVGAMPEASALTATYGSPTGWGAAYKLSGHAAIAWNYKFDKAGKKFTAGFPLTGALIEGVKVYDPRLDDTFPGGAGAHRVDDEATWEYSANPALHAGTYAYGRHQNGVRVMGAGLPFAGINFATVAAWANVCEANDWTISGVVFEPGDRWANLKEICAAGSGEPAFSGAVLGFRYDAPVVALDTVTEADVLDGMAVTFMQSYRDRLNTIIPKYRSADHNWEIVAAEPVQSATYLAEDGEERREEWPFNCVREMDQAAQLAAYKLVNSREFHPIKLTGMPRLRAYRPGDCLHLDLPRLGLDTDAVVLERKIDPATMTVELTFIGETDAKHAYALGLTGTAPAAPALGQDSEEKDVTAAGVAANPTLLVADEAELVALVVVPGTLAKRLDNGITYSNNGGTSGTIADWTAIGDVTSFSNELAQDAVGAMVDASLVYVDATPLLTRAALTGDVTAAQGSNALTLATVNSNIGAFGSATQSVQVTFNAKGLATAAANVTITPAVGSITGLGTNVATALAVNVGSAGAFVVNGGALGTPSSGDLANCTFPTLNQNTTGSAATLTTSRNFSISGGGITAATVGFNGSAAVVLSASVDAGHITLARMADIATDRLIGRDTAGTGVPEALTVGGGVEFTGSGGIQTSAFTGDVTKAAGGTALSIPNDTVTYAKMQNVSAQHKLLGRSSSGAGDVEEIDIGAWGSFTPTVTAETGSITSYTTDCDYKQVGKTVWLEIDVTLTDAGTAGGSINFTLPADAANARGAFAGAEVGATGVALACRLTSTTNLRMRRYDNAYIGSTGYRFLISGTYEIA